MGDVLISWSVTAEWRLGTNSDGWTVKERRRLTSVERCGLYWRKCDVLRLRYLFSIIVPVSSHSIRDASPTPHHLTRQTPSNTCPSNVGHYGFLRFPAGRLFGHYLSTTVLDTLRTSTQKENLGNDSFGLATRAFGYARWAGAAG